jgi:hypothetical protein
MIYPTREDIDALWEYHDGPAKSYFGMSYADGIRDMLDWLEENSPRPDQEDDE